MLEAAAVPKLQRRQQLLSADNDSNKEISMSPAMRHPTTQTRHTQPTRLALPGQERHMVPTLPPKLLHSPFCISD